MQLTMPKEINCINFKGLISYLGKNYGYSGIDAVIDGLIDNPDYLIHDLKDRSKIFPISREQIVDLNYWVSNTFSIRLLNNVRKVVKAPNPLFEAGRGAVKESLSKSALFVGRLFGPAFLARQATKINTRFNRTKAVVSRQPSRNELAFELRYFPRVEVTPDVCNWNLGIYTELMHAAGVGGIRSDEVRCVAKGDSCCEFRLQWEEPGLLRRIGKRICVWQVREQVRGVIEEYEGSLRERDRLIDEVAQSEEKYRSLFENTATANAIVESDHTISLVNSEFEVLTGYRKCEVEEKIKLPAMVRPVHAEEIGLLLDAGREQPSRTSDSVEIQLLAKGGEYKNVLCKVGCIPKTGKTIFSMMDVTARRQAEREKASLQNKLARAEKMEALGVLAGGVAHDLNNVLSGIVSYPELILLDLPQESRLRKPIETIRESGIRAAGIVQDLLTLARRDITVSDVVNLNDIIATYLQSAEYRKMISFHPGIALCFDADRQLLNMPGSPLSLSKVVMNLVTNAAEACTEGGEIRITTRNRYLVHPIRGYDKFHEGDYILLSVRDTGIGIPSKDIERIFEPFYSKKVMGRSGTGLGMTVVWGSVHDHNGHIDVHSEQGKGTTFELYFPATREETGEKKALCPLPALVGNGETILVVDDVKEQRDLAGAMLKRLGYRVHAVSSGEAAVDFVAADPAVDLLLVDMIMYPGIDGLETFRRIRRRYPRMKAIIVSGFSETDRVKNAQALGAGAYIRKPYLLETLAAAVKSELGGACRASG